MWTVLGTFGGLLFATLWNWNCTTAEQLLGGCKVIREGPVTLAGIGIGVLAGVLWALAQRAERRRRHPSED